MSLETETNQTSDNYAIVESPHQGPEEIYRMYKIFRKRPIMLCKMVNTICMLRGILYV
jgi:hypothetical protein